MKASGIPTTWPSSIKTVTATYPELENLSVFKNNIHPNNTLFVTSTRSWIESEYRAARSYEGVVINLSILPLLWRTKSQT